MRLSHDASNAAGDFRVVVPPGSYDLQYAPPRCTGLAPDQQASLRVDGATSAPPMTLVDGVHALGTVRDSATAVIAGVDLDFFAASTALKKYTPNDTTDASGAYDVVVIPEAYDIRYVPPAGRAPRPAWRTSVSLLTTTTLPDTFLPAGVLVSGSVVADATGLAVGGTEVAAR